MAFTLTRDKGQRMWGGGSNTFNGGRSGGGGGSGAGGGGGVSSSWVDENYVSKDYFNQLFKVKLAVRVLVTDPSTTPATVISDTTTVRQDLLYPNEVPEPTETTDEQTGYKTSTTYSIDSIQVMGGVWTNSYVSALGQNSSGGGGGGGSLNEPLSSINMAGLSAPGAAQDGMTIVWDQATGRWKYGSAGAGSVTSVGMTVPSGFSVSPATITSTGIFAITFASGYSLPTTAKQSNWDTAYGWGNHATAGYALTSNVYSKTECDERFLTIAFFRSLFRAYTSGNTEVTPNAGDTTTIDNIKAMFGFWTNAYISALGQNSSGGGGGGGSSTLAGLNDVQLGTLNANDVLIYDGNGHWINTSKSSFLSGYATTSDISDMATQTWVLGRGYITGISSTDVTTALGYTPLNSATTFWGQSVNNGVVNGSMTDVGNITFDGSEARRISPNGTALFIGNSDNANWVYMADMASQSGDSYWKIYSSGYAHFKRLYLDTNVYLEYDSTNGGVQLVGAGFYTSSYVSALGANSSGGGGGGSSTLAGLNDVQLGTLSADDILIYDGTGHWVNTGKSSFLSGYVTTSDISDMATKTWVGLQGYLTSVAFSDLTSHPTTLSGYGITDAKIASGIITLGNNTITPWTASNHPTTLSGYGITDAYISGGTIYLGSDSITPVTTETDPTVPAWAKESTKPSYSFSELTYHPTTLSGYGITDAVNSSTTWWGQSVSNGVVSGSLTNVGNITSNTNGSIYSFSAIEFGTASNSGNGGALYFHFPGVVGHASSYIIEQSEGVLSLLGAPPAGGNFGVIVGNANGTYLQIGGIRLVYDSTNNALKIVTSTNEAANLYATGSVSALGMSAGTSSVDAMTFNYVTINNELRLKNGAYTGSVFVDSNHNLCLSSSSGVIGTFGNTLYTEGGGIDTEDGDINAGGGTIITTGNVQAARFYLDATRYLYVSNGTLYYYNGTTAKQVAFTN